MVISRTWKFRDLVRKLDRQTSGEMKLNSGDHDARNRQERAHCVQVLVFIIERRGRRSGGGRTSPLQCRAKFCGHVEEHNRIGQPAQYPPDVVLWTTS